MNIIKLPAKVVLSGNPVVFGVRTTNHIISVGSKSKIVLFFGSINSQVGVQFKLNIMGQTLLFTCAGVPDDSGNQFRPAVISDTISTWMQKIYQDLSSNFYLSSYYDLFPGTNKIQIVAKIEGSEYNISGENVSVPNLSFVKTLGSNTIFRPFFGIYAELIVGSVKIGSDVIPVDSSGECYFNFSEYLRGISSSTFTYPEDVANPITLHSEASKEFYVRFSEYYSENGLNPIFHKVKATQGFYSIDGGVSSMTQALYNEYGTSFLQQLTVSHKFLTWRPTHRKTLISEIQKLWYLVHTNCTSIKLKVGLQFINSSGLHESTVLTKKIFSVSLFNILEINAGYSALSIANDLLLIPDARLISYDVFLTDQNDAIISEIVNFEINDRAYIHPRTFLFKNSFGVWESVTFTGELIIEAEYSNVLYSRYRSWNFTRKYTETFKGSSTETQKFSVNTGWMSMDECDWLRDLLLSNEIYEVKSGLLYPVVITANKLSVHKDDEYLYNSTIEYVHAFTDEHYSLPKINSNILPHIVVDIAPHSQHNSSSLPSLSTLL